VTSSEVLTKKADTEERKRAVASKGLNVGWEQNKGQIPCRSWKMRELGSGDEEDGWKLFPHPVLPSLLLVWVARFPREPGALAPLASPEHLRISCFHDPKEPQSRLWKSCGN